MSDILFNTFTLAITISMRNIVIKNAVIKYL